MFVRTERLFLRPGWPEDLDELVTAISDERVSREIGVTMLPETARAMREYLARPRDPRLPHFFMYLRSAGGAQLVGGIGLGRFGDDIEVGYWITPSHRGRGYAREAMAALLEQARSLGHRRVIASHFAESPDSLRVLQHAGFSDSGEFRERFSHGRNAPVRARIYVAELQRTNPMHIAHMGSNSPTIRA